MAAQSIASCGTFPKTGAALDVASPVGIPEHFILAILPDGSRHRCRIAWRKERRIGVAFSKA